MKFLFFQIGPCSAAGDLKAGAKIFEDVCSECHTMKLGKNKKGPSIYGLIGRKAATIGDYDYSEAIRKSNIAWSEEALDKYIENPAKIIPGGKMKYEGMKDADSRKNIIKYLKFFSEE